jgi:hypothetical protein
MPSYNKGFLIFDIGIVILTLCVTPLLNANRAVAADTGEGLALQGKVG